MALLTVEYLLFAKNCYLIDVHNYSVISEAVFALYVKTHYFRCTLGVEGWFLYDVVYMH